MFTTDALSNLYWLNNRRGDQIPVDGRTHLHLQQQTTGATRLVDASNPMQVLVLYPDVQSVVLLDSRMGQINLIKLLATR